MMRRAFLLGLLVVGAAALSVATASRATTVARTVAQAKNVVISTRAVPRLGTVLVNSRGLTLYMFVPDKRAKVTCKGTCAAVWPPVKLPKGAKPVAKGKAKARLLGSDRSSLGRVVTYAGWPLYTYVGDSAPGKATGQALNINGGLWYVLAPSGKVIRTKLGPG
jgi:predicted lipoprotein with Yx(FWY)xxD motif